MFGCRDFSEETLQAIYDLYDFTRCERPNGTFYGTGGQCIKGFRVDPRSEDQLKGIRERGNSEVEKFKLTGTQAKDEQKVQENVVKAFGHGLSPDKVKSYIPQVREEYNKIREEMKTDSVNAREVESFAKNFLGPGDLNTAKTVVIGMEIAAPAGKADEVFANHLAAYRVSQRTGGNPNTISKEIWAAEELVGPSPMAKIIRQSQDEKGRKFGIAQGGGQYYARQADMANLLDKNVELSHWKTLLSPQTATLELRAMPAYGTGQWDYANKSWVKANPKINQILGDKNNSRTKYDVERRELIVNKLIQASKTNKNLSTVFMALGNGREEKKTSYEVAKAFQKEGATVYEFKNSVVKDGVGRLIEFGPGKFVVDAGMSISGSKNLESFRNDVRGAITAYESGNRNGLGTLSLIPK